MSIESMLGPEKSGSTVNIQNMQATLLMIQETKAKTQEAIANNHEETKRYHEKIKTEMGEMNRRH